MLKISFIGFAGGGAGGGVGVGVGAGGGAGGAGLGAHAGAAVSSNVKTSNIAMLTTTFVHRVPIIFPLLF